MNKSGSFCLVFVAVAILVAGNLHRAQAQTASSYQRMSVSERSVFLNGQARRVARNISGREYQFTPGFVAVIQESVDAYVRRLGNSSGDQLGRGDARFIFERGRTYAPVLGAVFKNRQLSPLLGLYLPLIESEYINLESPNSMGAVGMFQFLPQTGKRYGLSAEDLLDVNKSADAAARYLLDSMATFRDDPMREALALLSYNRGRTNVVQDLAAVVNEQNRECSICALTAASSQLDQTFQTENQYYVPRFFAAAIIGENPAAFGLSMQPLSSSFEQ